MEAAFEFIDKKAEEFAEEAERVAEEAGLVEQLFTLKLGEVTPYVAKEGDSKQYSRLYLKDLSPDDNLVVKVITDDNFSDPDLYMSFTNMIPHSPASSDFRCASDGAETCTIPAARLQEESKRTGGGGVDVYLGITCKVSCKFQIYPSLQTVTHLSDNQEIQVKLDAQGSKLFKFRVPPPRDDINQKANILTGLNIWASSLESSKLYDQSDFVLSATTDQTAGPGTSASTGLHGLPIWTKGKGISIVNDENQDSSKGRGWCDDCWITIILSARLKGVYTLKAGLKMQN